MAEKRAVSKGLEEIIKTLNPSSFWVEDSLTTLSISRDNSMFAVNCLNWLKISAGSKTPQIFREGNQPADWPANEVKKTSDTRLWHSKYPEEPQRLLW